MELGQVPRQPGGFTALDGSVALQSLQLPGFRVSYVRAAEGQMKIPGGFAELSAALIRGLSRTGEQRPVLALAYLTGASDRPGVFLAG